MPKLRYRVAQAVILLAFAVLTSAQESRMLQEKPVAQAGSPAQNPLSIAKPIKVYLAGDSTMSNKEVKAYPET